MSFTPKDFADQIRAKNDLLQHNVKLLDIYEGNLEKYVLESLKNQLSDKALKMASSRTAPINVMNRAIEKISKIYSPGPERNYGIDQTENNNALNYYVQTMGVNEQFLTGNEYYNMFKNTFIEPFLHKGLPRCRVIPSDRFIVLSDDKVDPLNPTGFGKYMGQSSKNYQKWYVYSEDEFWIQNENGDILLDEMAAIGKQDGINEYGAIPGVYIQNSKNDLTPRPDSDLFKMTVLIPVMLTDLNFAQMYQSFSVIYGIDIDMENLFMSPNAVWSLKSDAGSDKKPEVGTIKPTIDLVESSSYIKELFAMWMQSKSIRSNSSFTGEKQVSGFSKAIDEMDTSEARNKQVPVFQCAEYKFWALIADNMTPVWEKDPMFQAEHRLPKNTQPIIKFKEQRPEVNESTMIDNSIKKLDKRLTTFEKAVRESNPNASEQEIQDILKEQKPAYELSQKPQEQPNELNQTENDPNNNQV